MNMATETRHTPENSFANVLPRFTCRVEDLFPGV